MKIDLSKQELATIVAALKYWAWEPLNDDGEQLLDQHPIMSDIDMLILVTRLTEAHNHDLP